MNLLLLITFILILLSSLLFLTAFVQELIPLDGELKFKRASNQDVGNLNILVGIVASKLVASILLLIASVLGIIHSS